MADSVCVLENWEKQKRKIKMFAQNFIDRKRGGDLKYSRELLGNMFNKSSRILIIKLNDIVSFLYNLDLYLIQAIFL